MERIDALSVAGVGVPLHGYRPYPGCNRPQRIRRSSARSQGAEIRGQKRERCANGVTRCEHWHQVGAVISDAASVGEPIVNDASTREPDSQSVQPRMGLDDEVTRAGLSGVLGSDQGAGRATPCGSHDATFCVDTGGCQRALRCASHSDTSATR
jgi:hypothetical protein